MPVPDGGRSTQALDGVVATRSTTRTAASTATTSPATPRQQVEWVNLRVTGIGPITRPELATIARSPRDGRAGARAHRTPAAVCFDADEGYVDTPVYWRPRPARPATASTGPAVDRGVRLDRARCTPASPPRVDELGNLLVIADSAERA